MNPSTTPPETPVERAWPDLSDEELEELKRDFAEADAEYQRGESLPVEEVLPRYPRAG